ncbi:MAG: hypothetical protein EOP86_03565 [Verrucomicrobiaceae bacterium]|nr:MAG: hypothetical protein EOP86_03565 [Verrucomicrobiaceae bacterium]
MRARFPDWCPFTGQRHPGGSVGIISQDVLVWRDWWNGWLRTEVPCAPSHWLRVHLHRCWVSVRDTLTGLGACAVGVLVLIYGPESEDRGWLALGFSALFLMAVMAWERFHPPAFTVYVRADKVYYDFRDPDYAREFAALNPVRRPG